MGLFGNKFNKIKRSDVVDTIISLEKQQQDILEQIENRNKTCDEYMKKGKLEKDTNMRMYYAKKISTMKKENLLDTKRLQFIDSNILSMQQLKNALDDKEFIKNNSMLKSIVFVVSTQRGKTTPRVCAIYIRAKPSA